MSVNVQSGGYVCPLTYNRVAAHRNVSRPVLCLVSRCCSVFVMFHNVVVFRYGVVSGLIGMALWSGARNT